MMRVLMRFLITGETLVPPALLQKISKLQEVYCVAPEQVNVEAALFLFADVARFK